MPHREQIGFRTPAERSISERQSVVDDAFFWLRRTAQTTRPNTRKSPLTIAIATRS